MSCVVRFLMFDMCRLLFGVAVYGVVSVWLRVGCYIVCVLRVLFAV